MKVLITAILVPAIVQAVVLVVDLAAVPVNHDHQALMEISQGVKDLLSVINRVVKEPHLAISQLLGQNVLLATNQLLADHQAKALADKENRAHSQIVQRVIVLQIAHLVEIHALEVTFQEKEAHAKK